MGDNLATWFVQIWKDEFRTLRDKVWFLDYWELTLAIENRLLHPNIPTVVQMLKLLFGYMCDD